MTIYENLFSARPHRAKTDRFGNLTRAAGQGDFVQLGLGGTPQFEVAGVELETGAPVRIGFAAQGRGPLLTHKLRRGPLHSGRRQVHDYLDIVAECERVCLGGNLDSRSSNLESQVSNPLPTLIASPAQRQAADSLLRSAGVDSDSRPLSRPLVALNAGATNSRAKRWPEDRFAALEAFRRGQYPVLVATDVAARGIDVEGISHVVNFDVPFSSDDYIHRGGRTARAGAVGELITFVSPAEEERLRDIEKAIGTIIPRVVLPNFDPGVHVHVPPPVTSRPRRRRRRPV